MKYVNDARKFTTRELSLDETIQEAMDVVDIAAAALQRDSDVALALENLKQAQNYLAHIRAKAAVAIKHVPTDVQTQEYL